MQSQQEDHRHSQQQHARRQQLEEACQPNKKDEEHREDSICMAAVGSAMQLCAGLWRIRAPTAGLYILIILPRVCTHSMTAVVTMLGGVALCSSSCLERSRVCKEQGSAHTSRPLDPHSVGKVLHRYASKRVSSSSCYILATMFIIHSHR